MTVTPVGWLAGLLLHAVWIAAAAAAATWVALRRNWDPQAAHSLAVGGMMLTVVGLLAIGIVTWPRLGSATPVLLSQPGQTVRLTPTLESLPASTTLRMPSSTTGPDWQALLVLAWVCGVLTLSLRQAYGCWYALRLRCTATRLAGGLADRLKTLCHQAGVAPPMLLTTSRLAVPAAIGWWRPAVLVPLGMCAGLTPAQVDALLLHELAHLRRHDWLIEIAVSTLECLLFFHPAVWWLGRRLRQAREQCCDGQAVRYGAEPDGLARALLAIAERVAPRAPLLAATGGILADRVRRLLGLPERRRSPWQALAVIGLLPALLGATVACTRAEAPVHASGSSAVDARGWLEEASPPPTLSLAERIAARADGRAVSLVARTISAPPAFWATFHFDGDATRVLDGATGAKMLDEASRYPLTHITQHGRVVCAAAADSLTCIVHAVQQGYIEDYELFDGLLDPKIGCQNIACSVLRLYARPQHDDVLFAAGAVMEETLIGYETLSFRWPGFEQPFPLQQPVALIEGGRISPGTRIRTGDMLAVPLAEAMVARSGPRFGYAIEHGTIDQRISDPKPSPNLRRVCLITAELQANDDGDTRFLMRVPEAAAWLDSARISLDLEEASLEEALFSLAAQLRVKIEVDLDAGYDATRVSLSAHNVPARQVLVSLLRQTMLQGAAEVDRLRLFPYDPYIVEPQPVRSRSTFFPSGD